MAGGEISDDAVSSAVKVGLLEQQTTRLCRLLKTLLEAEAEAEANVRARARGVPKLRQLEVHSEETKPLVKMEVRIAGPICHPAPDLMDI